MNNHDIENERIKISAFLNGVAIAIFAIGGLAPWTTFLSGSSQASPLAILVVSVLSLSASAGVHALARILLERLW